MNNPHRTSLTCLGGVLLVSFLVVHYTSDRHPSSARHISLSTSAGARLPSLFEGVSANPKMVRLRARLDARQAHPSCAAPSRLTRLLSLVGIGPIIVHAQSSCEWSCGNSGCGGQPDNQACSAINCGGGNFTYGYSEADPGSGLGDEGAGSGCEGNGCNSVCVAQVCYACQY